MEANDWGRVSDGSAVTGTAEEADRLVYQSSVGDG